MHRQTFFANFFSKYNTKMEIPRKNIFSCFFNRSQTIAKEISSSRRIRTADSNRRWHTPISRFRNDANQDFFLVSRLLCVSVRPSLSPPLPFHGYVPPFLSSAKKGGELWANVRLDGVKDSLGQLHPFLPPFSSLRHWIDHICSNFLLFTTEI